MEGWIPALLGTGIFLVLFLLEYRRRRAMEQRVDQMVNALERFLLEGEKNLEISLEEGKMQNLQNQLAALEDYALYIRKCGREGEARLNRFMENMAHQMKTSLTALQIRVDLAQLKAEGMAANPAQNGENAGNISQELENAGNPAMDNRVLEELLKCQKCLLRLSGEVERILECSRLADGKIAMHPEPCDVEELLKKTLDILEPLRQKRGVTIGWETDQLPRLYLDRYWFSQALENVLKNALEHTRPQTTVQVRIRDCVKYFTIQIRDEGPGIADEELPHIFERFHRGTHTKAGYGIGLSMARDVLKAHHGELSVKNGERAGACFELQVPFLEGQRAYGESGPEK